MSALMSFASAVVLIVVVYLGFKILRNIIAAIIVAIILAYVLYYFGFLLP